MLRKYRIFQFQFRIDQFHHGARAFGDLRPDQLGLDRHPAFFTAHLLDNPDKIGSGINQGSIEVK